MTLNEFLSTINTECQYNIKCGINTYLYNEKTSIPQKYKTMKIESVQIKIKQVLIHYITAHTDRQTQTNYYMPTLRNIRHLLRTNDSYEEIFNIVWLKGNKPVNLRVIKSFDGITENNLLCANVEKIKTGIETQQICEISLAL